MGTRRRPTSSAHDLGHASRLAGKIIFLVRGRIVEHAPNVFSRHLQLQRPPHFYMATS